MKTSELAKLLGVDVRQIDAWCKSGMPHRGPKSKRKRQFDPGEVYKWLVGNGHAVESPDVGQASLLVGEGKMTSRDACPTKSPTNSDGSLHSVPYPPATKEQPAPPPTSSAPIMEAGEGLVLRTRAECAQFFGVHVRTIASWLLEPDFPGRAGDKGEQNGYFPASRISQWMQARARSSAAVPNPTRQKLDEVKLAQAEYKLQQERGELVPMGEVIRLVQRAAAIARTRLESLPDKLVELLPANVDARLRESFYEQAAREVALAAQTVGRALIEDEE